MDFQIFRATKKDAVEMGIIHSCSWKEAYSGIIPNEIISEFTPTKRAEMFSNAIGSRPEEYYLFKVDGCPAGIASLSKCHEENAPANVGEIYSIYFRPDYWGSPATQAAFNFCVDRLKALGYDKITIWVLNDNSRDKKFYEKNGFTLDGHTQEIEIGTKLLEVRYSKDI